MYDPVKLPIQVENSKLYIVYANGKSKTLYRSFGYCYSDNTERICLGKFINGNFSFNAIGEDYDVDVAGECSLIKK
jgi:hypothetical protein